MRTMVLAGVLLACGTDPDPLPPPPANAVASCASEQTPYLGVSTSTIWLDVANRVIRVDGAWYEDNGDSYAIPYHFDYDDEGRLAATRFHDYDYRYDYTTQRILRTERGKDNWLWNLVDGRVMHEEGPLDAPSLRHVDYEYDSSGRITRRSGQDTMKAAFDRRFTYDAQGRVETVEVGNRTKTWTYTESPTQLAIHIDETQFGQTAPYVNLTYDFDANHRIVRSARDSGGDSGGDGEVTTTYTYLDGEFDTELSRSGVQLATFRSVGACEPPAIVVAPQLPLPFRWIASYVRVPNIATDFMLYEL